MQSQKLNLKFPPIEHYVTFQKFVLIQILTDALTNESFGLRLFSLGMHDIKSKYNGHKFMHTKKKEIYGEKISSSDYGYLEMGTSPLIHTI